MRRFLLASAVLVSVTAAGGIAYRAAADTAPATPMMAQPPGPPGAFGPADGPGRGPGAGPGQFWGRNGCGPGGWGQSGRGFGPGKDDKFGLFAPAKDKNLSSADVKIIATAILLEHGNHDWAVSDLVNEPDKTIQFSFSTQHGDVIATFAIDPASGHIKRVS